jgi:hypothetical protein
MGNKLKAFGSQCCCFYTKNEIRPLRPPLVQDWLLRCGKHLQTSDTYCINLGTVDAPNSETFSADAG